MNHGAGARGANDAEDFPPVSSDPECCAEEVEGRPAAQCILHGDENGSSVVVVIVKSHRLSVHAAWRLPFRGQDDFAAHTGSPGKVAARPVVAGFA